jgi:hypothetical protein
VAEPGRAGATPGAPAPVEAEFDALKAREAGSLDELRRVREEWRSFLSRHPQGPRADEARVEMIAVSVEIAVRTRAVADEAEARGQARAYLARSGAAQKERVRALVARLGGNP